MMLSGRPAAGSARSAASEQTSPKVRTSQAGRGVSFAGRASSFQRRNASPAAILLNNKKNMKNNCDMISSRYVKNLFLYISILISLARVIAYRIKYF